MLKLSQSRELCSEKKNLHTRAIDAILFSVINVECSRPFCSMCCKILHKRKQRSDPNPIICNSRSGWNRIKVGRADNILAQSSQGSSCYSQKHTTRFREFWIRTLHFHEDIAAFKRNSMRPRDPSSCRGEIAFYRNMVEMVSNVLQPSEYVVPVPGH